MSFGTSVPPPPPAMPPAPAPTHPPAVGDAASLRVALSMIDDWDHEFSSLFELEADQRPLPTGRKAPSAARTQRATAGGATTAPYQKPRRGDARKLEALELRAQIEDLQRVIDSEKAKFVVVEKLEDSQEARALRDEWGKMSLRQESQRFAAQVENEKLRALVESQRKGAQKIVQLAQRVAILEQSLPPLEMAPFAEQYQGPKEDPQVQLQRLVRTEREAKSVFSGGAFAKSERMCFREVQFRDRSPDADGGIEITFEMAWVLPFCVDDVAEALWIQSTRITSKDKTVEWMDLYEDATTIVSQYISSPTSTDNNIVNHGQLASRRLPKNEADDSIMFVSNHQGRAFEHSQCKGLGNGDAWIRIERVASHKPSSRIHSPLTQVKWSRRVVIHPPAYDCMSTQERSQWINAVITGPMRGRVESNLDWNVQAVENILLSSKTRVASVASPVES